MRAASTLANKPMTPADLKSSRRALGLSGRRFADLVGVDVSALRKWEAGHRPIPRWLYLLVALLHLPAVQVHLGISQNEKSGPA